MRRASARFTLMKASSRRVASAKIEGLIDRYGISDEETLRFFRVHESADVEHSAVCRALARPAARGRAGRSDRRRRRACRRAVEFPVGRRGPRDRQLGLAAAADARRAVRLDACTTGGRPGGSSPGRTHRSVTVLPTLASIVAAPSARERCIACAASCAASRRRNAAHHGGQLAGLAGELARCRCRRC